MYRADYCSTKKDDIFSLFSNQNNKAVLIFTKSNPVSTFKKSPFLMIFSNLRSVSLSEIAKRLMEPDSGQGGKLLN